MACHGFDEQTEQLPIAAVLTMTPSTSPQDAFGGTAAWSVQGRLSPSLVLRLAEGRPGGEVIAAS
jgi:hypothetical protein